MDENDTADLPTLTPEIERRNRIERLASPEGADDLRRRIEMLSCRIHRSVAGPLRILHTSAEAETMEAAQLALRVLFKGTR